MNMFDCYQLVIIEENDEEFFVLKHRNPKTGELGDLADEERISTSMRGQYDDNDRVGGISGYLRNKIGQLFEE